MHRSMLGIVLLAAGLGRVAWAADNPNDWPMYGHDIRRTAFNASETKINRTSVAMLIPKWVFHAGDSITASPVVVNFDDFIDKTGTHLGPKKVIYVGSADENFYAVDAATGTEIWHFTADPAPTIGYNMFVSSAFVDKARGQLYVGGGFTMYALDLYSGAVKWKWSTASRGGGEIESSPTMVNDTVYFGSDQDGSVPTANPKYPAVFALNAADGTLQWYWRPAKPPNPDHCGSVWSSLSADPEESLLYFATADCGRSHQGIYNEAVIALSMVPDAGTVNATSRERTGPPNWYYQPRDIDPYDYDFGSTSLLFDRDGKKYVGIGGKDGSYYVLERQRSATPGAFRATAWNTRVVRGGYAAGFLGASATDGEKIYGATALFDIPPTPNPLLQPPYMHSFDAGSGTIAWQQIASGPTFAATTGVPGVIFVGSTDGIVQALDTETGQVLWVWPVLGAVSSGGAISDGEFFIGAGTTAKAYGLGQGPLNGLFAFHLAPIAPAAPDPSIPPKLPPAMWPLGVLQMPVPADGTTPAVTPTP